MFSFLLLLLGIAIIVIVFIDFIVTVFMSKGAGFLTEIISTSVAKIFKKLVGHKGDNHLLDYTGLVIIITMVTTWVTFLWLGTTLIYQFESGSIIHNETKTPASFIEKLYFTGYTLSTLGMGDYLPNGIFWQIYTAVASFTGFIILTVCITYIVPVINNIIEKNVLSLRIASLGESTVEFLNNAYDGESFDNICDQMSPLANEIFRYSKNHLAYPILHHVHNSDKAENTILKLVSLDESIGILLYHIPKSKCPQRINLQQVRRSITSYLNSIKYIQPSATTPPLPDFERISQMLGIELINTQNPERQKLYEELNLRRRFLKGIVEDDGWEWKDLEGEKYETELEAKNTP